ncbi:hypothetical protein [Komagataeibacter europaeus]|uniref:hypothetical protein n=1 Tax=Komagataeibacter europaeus TaxID=33995 RepID=UPI0015F8EF86|nr:hypothetical protein [Komagataeibacter europaeus]
MILIIFAIVFALIIFFTIRSLFLPFLVLICILWVVDKVESPFRKFDAYQHANYAQSSPIKKPDFPDDVTALIAKEEKENDVCRGTHPPDNEAPCVKRDATIKELASLGACWGPDNIAEADKDWIKCAPRHANH